MAKKLFTTRQVAAGFGVTPVTLHNWRTGTPTRAKMPSVHDGRAVRFELQAMKDYAAAHHLTFDVKAADAVSGDAATGRKPGSSVDKVATKSTPVARKTAAKAPVATKVPAPSRARRGAPVAVQASPALVSDKAAASVKVTAKKTAPAKKAVTKR